MLSDNCRICSERRR